MYGKSPVRQTPEVAQQGRRIITFSDYNTRSADILQDLGWDTLEQRRSKQLAISVVKSFIGITYIRRV